MHSIRPHTGVSRALTPIPLNLLFPFPALSHTFHLRVLSHPHLVCCVRCPQIFPLHPNYRDLSPVHPYPNYTDLSILPSFPFLSLRPLPFVPHSLCGCYCVLHGFNFLQSSKTCAGCNLLLINSKSFFFNFQKMFI